MCTCAVVEHVSDFRWVKMSLSGLSLKQDRYVSLLDKLIGESEFLQDNPPKFVPQENRYSCFMKIMQLLTG